ncbi:MAG: glycosyltransferase family 4 protein [Ignavibacteria bacterium]|nr:glycosyltransferase family 4 protein [Ignavibacteria bacterium]MCU7503335.1 glycosyltransferase family 4 protein [Ignavibacteria bacterium]MCU7515719.1 glycosyltransferase family 4 protein [Ignavibacteria bacterium]
MLTVNEDTFSAKDESLLNEVAPDLEVMKTGYFDPFTFYRKFLGKSQDEPLIASETISKTNKSLKHRISIWIRMNLFVPDARIGWYPGAVARAKEYLRENKVDAIVSIGPPHSTHLIGKKLSSIYGIPHVPVLIDPWVDIVYYRDFKRNFLTLALDNYFEKSVMKQAGRVVFVTNNTREDFVRKYPFLKDKSHVLYWGYNEDSFEGLQEKPSPSEKILLHAGNIFDYQNQVPFWQTVKKQVEKGNNIRLKFLGTVGPQIKKSLEELGLSSRVEYSGFLPYGEVVREMLRASYLLVCATEPRHLPGKLFEYLRTGRPIIAFGDDNREVEDILRQTNAGMLFPYNSPAAEFFEKAESLKTDVEKVRRFDRRTIARDLSKILDSVIG